MRLKETPAGRSFCQETHLKSFQKGLIVGGTSAFKSDEVLL